MTAAGIAAQVDTLEAEGRLREAITVLDAHAGGDDRELTRRLLRIRYAAYGQDAPAGDAPTSWPPAFSDPFPGCDDPPEIAADQLSPAVVGGAIVHHGSLLVRGLVPSSSVSWLVDGIDRAFATLDAWLAADRDPAATSGWFEPFDTGESPKNAMREWVRAGGGVWAVESPFVAARILGLYGAAGLRETLNGYFGETPAVALEKLTLRKVGTETFPSWHQDGSFLGDDIRSCNVWLALSDCGGEASVPALDIVARRVDDLLETGTHGAALPDAIGHDLVASLAGDAIVRPRFRAGDALLFDDRLVHRSAVDEGMHGFRYAVEAWFFAPSRFPRTYRGLTF